MNIAQLPAEIRSSMRAVVWKYEQRDGRQTKVPYVPAQPLRRAAVDDATTWGPFAAALETVAAGRADGTGIVLGAGLVGVDLDHCRDERTGQWTTAAQVIVARLDSYTEVSPSGTGLHILARGSLPAGRRRRGHVELYDTGRYFTVTGAHLAGTPREIHERSVPLAALHAQLFPPPALVEMRSAYRNGRSAASDAELIAKAHETNGSKFATLWRGDWGAYPSQSEADLALANYLAYWTDADAGRMDRLFRQSGLMRPKWDQPRGGTKYGERTIATAIATNVRSARGGVNWPIDQRYIPSVRCSHGPNDGGRTPAVAGTGRTDPGGAGRRPGNDRYDGEPVGDRAAPHCGTHGAVRAAGAGAGDE